GARGLGPELLGEAVEVDLLSPGQWLQGGASAGGVRSGVEAGEALLAQDLGDPGAIERGGRVLEGLGDLVDGEALAAALDELWGCGLLARRRRGPWLGEGEEVEAAGAEVAEE